ncbi:MAG: glycosyltransferase family 1 protein [Gammaproteobacteria bacterium]|nr:MAG: glycosyltransferase family 1 protein [Gammaproteobacteria bacterium]
MHIAYLDPHPVPDNCPEALQILYTVDALGSLGARVTLVTPKPASVADTRAILGHALSPNVQVRHLEPRHGIWRWLRSNKPFYRMAANELKTLGADAVLVRNLKMAEHLLRRAPEVPLFFETHELFARSYQEEHKRLNLRKHHKLAALAQREETVYRGARGLIALTPLLIDDIRQAYGVETPAVVAPDGVDLEQARAPVSATPHTTPWLLYLGSLHPWKGVDTLIRAIPHVKQPAELHIVGGSDERIAELRKLAEELNVAARVVFHGPVEPGKRFEYIHQADICLLPLTDTGLGGRYTSPLKLFEYMAAGKAIIVSDLPSMRQVLTPEQDALLVPTGNPEAFGRAIEKLLTDKGLRMHLGGAAKFRVQAFSWRARSETILRFIGERLGHAS